MKKSLLYVLFGLSSISYAQDQLFKKDNSKVEVKILEINQNEIKYKLFTYQDGPTISIAKKEVALIIYQNGVHEVLNTTPEAAPQTPYTVYASSSYNYPSTPRVNQDSIDKAVFNDLVRTKNLISFNTMDPINGSFSISYIREFANNYLHVYVPVSVGFATPIITQAVNTTFSGNSLFSGNNNNNYNPYNYFSISDFKLVRKTYEAGLGIHFQSSGKHPVTHFIGPYVGISQFTGTYSKYETTYDPNLGYGTNNNTTDKTFAVQRINIMLDNGVLFRVTKNFNIMLLAAIGYHIDEYTSDDDLTKAINYNKNQFPLNAFKFGLNFGYRF